METQEQENTNLPTPENPLSERELVVAILLALDFKPKVTGEKLFISPHTVRTHKDNIYRKTGCHGRAKLLVYLLINNLCDLQTLADILNLTRLQPASGSTGSEKLGLEKVLPLITDPVPVIIVHHKEGKHTAKKKPKKKPVFHVLKKVMLCHLNYVTFYFITIL